MSRICLDTSAYSHFKKGAAEAVSAIESARGVVLEQMRRVGVRILGRHA